MLNHKSYFFVAVGIAFPGMLTSSGITALHCDPNIARSLRDCTIKQGTCSESVMAVIACGSSVITGEL